MPGEKVHADEVDIDAARARRLLPEQFPRLGGHVPAVRVQV
jgi:hypothetical protein